MWRLEFMHLAASAECKDDLVKKKKSKVLFHRCVVEIRIVSLFK